MVSSDSENSVLSYIVRVDFNVPVDTAGRITDATRLERHRAPVKELLNRGGRVTLLSHFGRPGGVPHARFSFAPLVDQIESYLDLEPPHRLHFVPYDAVPQGPRGHEGSLVLLENTRFWPGETTNDPDFARMLAQWGQIFVNDALSVSHRAHASVVGLARVCRKAEQGAALKNELDALRGASYGGQSPKSTAGGAAASEPRPRLMAVVGGSKISTKLQLLYHLASYADYLVVGGALATHFLLDRGHPIGKSLYESSELSKTEAIEKRARETGCRLLLPEDVCVANSLESPDCSVRRAEDVRPDDIIGDLGPETVNKIRACLQENRRNSFVMNGPLGIFERPAFARGTFGLFSLLGQMPRRGRPPGSGQAGQAELVSAVAGGGDSLAALALYQKQTGGADPFDFVSTAGGAFLAWLSGETLPGLEVLAEVSFSGSPAPPARPLFQA